MSDDPPIPKYAVDPQPYLSEQLRIIERLAVGRPVLMRGAFEVKKSPYETGEGPHPMYTSLVIGYGLIRDGLAKPSDAFGKIDALPRVIGLHARLVLHPAWRTFLRSDEPPVVDSIGGRGAPEEESA